jgi:FMN phosphatase YigB (HAD superfamily)
LGEKAASSVAQDFDGTQANTAEPSPQGIGVEEAYGISIERIFGERALQFYQTTGHDNRTPAEITETLVPYATDPKIFGKIVTLTELGYPAQDIISNLGSLKTRIGTARDSLDPEELDATTKLLTDLKVEQLVAQVGLKLADDGYWPRPIDGFIDFCNQLEATRQSDGAWFDTAVISAGHTDLIRSIHEMWGIRLMDIYITSDTVVEQGLTKVMSPTQIGKPAPTMFNMAECEWLRQYNQPPEAHYPERMLYVGDDLDRDGGLATNCGIDFVHISPQAPAESWQRVQRKLKIGSYAVGGGSVDG